PMRPIGPIRFRAKAAVRHPASVHTRPQSCTMDFHRSSTSSRFRPSFLFESKPIMQVSARVCFVMSLCLGIAPASLCFGQKDALYESLAKREDQAWSAALQIWSWAEPGYQEEKSSALLAKMLEDAGF